VEVDAFGPELADGLQRLGLQVEGSHRRLVVTNPTVGGDTASEGTPNDPALVLRAVRDTAADLGAPIRRLQQGKTSLEDLFLTQVGSR